VNEAKDLRKVLADNIRLARKSLDMSQAALAQESGLSLPSIISIEQCKTWVSDKTLNRLAEALSREAFELLMPSEPAETDAVDRCQREKLLAETGNLIKAQRENLKQAADASMNELFRQMIKLL
jgi:transcriptional regulator with XRE-family HTH domain